MHRLGNMCRSITVSVLMLGFLGGCDFIEPVETNPNSIPTATMDQILTAVQVNAFSFAEGHLGRLAAMWTQQMAGTDRQFVSLDSWQFTEEEGDDYYNGMYTGGGLVDIRRGVSLAEEAATKRAQTLAGILKLHEAYLIGMGASIWGDIVYREAVDPEKFPQPKLDSQLQVYADVQALLDEAIADLTAGGNQNIGADVAFGGNAARWIAIANSLKARFYLHTGELPKAITAAGAGIKANAGDWMTVHSTSSAEDNHWWEFMVEQRSGYISAGRFMVDLLKNNNDPRLAIYFSRDSEGGYSGSPPAQSGGGWSELGAAFGAQSARHAIISCAETYFIAAEAHARLGNAAAAQTALNAGIDCQEARWNVQVPTYSANLLSEILTQKYIANFLNIETWMDYRRTCQPNVRSTETPAGGRRTRAYPSRLYYADNETQNNENIPTASTPGNTLSKADMENLSGFWKNTNTCLP